MQSGRLRIPRLTATRPSFQRSQGSSHVASCSVVAPLLLCVEKWTCPLTRRDSLLFGSLGAVRIGPRGGPAQKQFSAVGERKIGADPASRPILGLIALDD